ncbi:hypothetical protein Taro_032070 [Colocasia esculenta]|uniref:Uncharacterized protein n=1 Tax=Colocasia esculenta TaxID=4460 RepID=A0A843W511_COLES|nr:hypothetical protein [Colocasia esculenta]
MKAKHFLNKLRPAYITQLAPLDIQTYPKLVKKAQLLEDATDLTDRIKGRMVKKEQTSGAPSKPTNGKKRLLSITDGPSQERKPKVFAPTAPNKPRCKHCDKLGHITEECWRKVEERGLRMRSKERKGLEQGGSLFFFVINPRSPKMHCVKFGRHGPNPKGPAPSARARAEALRMRRPDRPHSQPRQDKVPRRDLNAIGPCVATFSAGRPDLDVPPRPDATRIHVVASASRLAPERVRPVSLMEITTLTRRGMRMMLRSDQFHQPLLSS